MEERKTVEKDSWTVECKLTQSQKKKLPTYNIIHQ